MRIRKKIALSLLITGLIFLAFALYSLQLQAGLETDHKVMETSVANLFRNKTALTTWLFVISILTTGLGTFLAGSLQTRSGLHSFTLDFSRKNETQKD